MKKIAAVQGRHWLVITGTYDTALERSESARQHASAAVRENFTDRQSKLINLIVVNQSRLKKIDALYYMVVLG